MPSTSWQKKKKKKTNAREKPEAREKKVMCNWRRKFNALNLVKKKKKKNERWENTCS